MRGSILNKEEVYKGAIFNVEKQTIQTPHHLIVNREIVTHSPVVVIVAIDQNDNIVITDEYRAGVNKVTKGLPAGFIDKGELPYTAAIREFTEETGYQPIECVEMLKINSSEGFTDEVAHLFLIRFNSSQKEKVHFDQDEFLESKLINKEKVKEMLLQNEIESSQVVSALGYFFLQESYI